LTPPNEIFEVPKGKTIEKFGIFWGIYLTQFEQQKDETTQPRSKFFDPDPSFDH